MKRPFLYHLKTQALVLMALFSSVIVILSFVSILGLYQATNSFEIVAQSTHQSTEAITPLQLLTKDIKTDVIQVQQWLTDISATRGLPGFDDGFGEAQKYADQFSADLDAAQALAQTLNNGEIQTKLNALREAFPPFYDMGKTMAQSYIDQGPEGGNAMMENFDATAEKMTDAIVQLETSVMQLRLDHSTTLISQVDGWSEDTGSDLILTAILAVIGLGFVALALWKVNGVVEVMKSVSNALATSAKGDMNFRIVNIKRNDEAGQIQHNFNDLLDLTEAFMREVSGAMTSASKGKYSRHILIKGMLGDFIHTCGIINQSLEFMEHKISDFSGLTDDFETNVINAVHVLSTNRDSIEKIATNMGQDLDTSGNRSLDVTEAAQNATNHVSAVSVAAEQLSASINEISQQVSSSSKITVEAVADANLANEKISKLANATAQISQVVSLINDISEQTNLLALNATIEAARAGEHGKGFAVVATEVKNLAKQVNDATEQISGQIKSIMGDANEAVEAINVISRTIHRVDEITGSIAAAVEEQSAATDEIARSVDTVMGDMDVVSNRVSQVSRLMIKSYGSGIKVLWATQDLKAPVKLVDEKTGEFLASARAI